VLRLKLILTIKGGFCYDITQLFYGTVLKSLAALIVLIVINSLTC